MFRKKLSTKTMWSFRFTDFVHFSKTFALNFFVHIFRTVSMNLESALNSAIFLTLLIFWRENNSSVILALFANFEMEHFEHARIKNLFCKHHLCLHASLPRCQLPIYSCVLISLPACLLVCLHACSSACILHVCRQVSFLHACTSVQLSACLWIFLCT